MGWHSRRVSGDRARSPRAISAIGGSVSPRALPGALPASVLGGRVPAPRRMRRRRLFVLDVDCGLIVEPLSPADDSSADRFGAGTQRRDQRHVDNLPTAALNEADGYPGRLGIPARVSGCRTVIDVRPRCGSRMAGTAADPWLA